MSDTWLILDCHFLCHRAIKSAWNINELSYKGIPTGVAFGFLSAMLGVQEVFGAQHLVFCFDMGISLRKKALPCYKANRHKPRKNETVEEFMATRVEAHKFRQEVRYLRTTILPSIGYPNILASSSFEADDWIAKACRVIKSTWLEDEVVIVSSDHDLLQCLSSRVRMYNPTKRMTHTMQQFQQQWGLPPSDWPTVKALAGCSGDNIPGIRGIGEKTAAKYLRRELATNTKKYQAIVSAEGQATCERNLPLVKLPHKTTPDFIVVKEPPTQKSWKAVIKDLGMHTLENQGPYTSRRKRKVKDG